MTKKPNLLIIHTDQQSSWSIGAYGGKLLETPSIDSIARQGAIFNNCFTPSAVCTPSRGSFLTGRYPNCNGAHANNLELGRDEVTLAHILQNNGYETGYIGKWHLDGPDRPGWIEEDRSMGFKDCRYMYNRGHWKKILDRENDKPFVSNEVGEGKSFTTDWLADKSIDFIRNRNEKPFFLMLSIPDPHFPFKVSEPYHSMFNRDDMIIPPSFYQEDRPIWLLNTEIDIKGAGWTEKDLKEAMAIYCGMVKCIDDNVGRILSCLNGEGILDDTIVVFTTDHGEYLGEHGIYAKNALYETAYRIPMLIRWPEKIKEGTVIDRFFSLVDFQQTILGLVNIGPSGREQGRDASPLLRGESIDWIDEAYIHYSSFTRAGIFTPEYELAYVKDSEHILFDRLFDPEQINNLYYDPKYREIINDLKVKILEHNRSLNSPALEWLEKV